MVRLDPSKLCKISQKFHHKLLNDTINDNFKKINNLTRWIKHRRSSLIHHGFHMDKLEGIFNTFLPQLETYHFGFKRKRVEGKLKKLRDNNLITNRNNQLVTNISNKVQFLDLEINDDTFPILAKGPNYAITTSINKSSLQNAEANIERFAYAYRTVKTIETSKQAHLDDISGATHSNMEDASSITSDNLLGVPSDIPIESNVSTNIPSNDDNPTCEDTQEPLFTVRNPNTHKYQPYQLPHTEESNINKLKCSIMDIYKKHKPTKPNITSKQRKQLNNLAKDKEIIIKKADKDKKFVISSRDYYVNHTHEDLSSTTTYKKIAKNPVNEMENSATYIINKVLKDIEPDWKNANLKSYYPIVPQYYSLWKTHKQGYSVPPRRPVVSKIGTPLQNISKLVAFILNQAVQFVPTHIKSSDNFIAERKCSTVPKDSILVAADIKALYTNIPLDHSRFVIIKFLEQFYDNLNTYGVTLDQLSEILEIINDNGYFCFDDEYYLQVFGLPMGDNPAAAIVIIYVYCVIEKPLLENDFTYISSSVTRKLQNCLRFSELLHQLDDWKRYLDDVYSVFNGTLEEATELFTYIDILHDSIQFPDPQIATCIEFLDFIIYINPSTYALEFELFIKPTNVGIFLNYNSAHPKSMIINSARNELRRAIKRSNTPENVTKSISKISNLLLDNEYPTHLVIKLSKEVQLAAAEVQTSSNIHKRAFLDDSIILKLDYIDEQHKRKVLKSVHNSNISNIKVIFMPGKKLGDSLMHTKLNPIHCIAQSGKCYVCNTSEHSNNCMSKNYVYLLTCSICNDVYIGESQRLYYVRMREHYNSIINGNDSHAMGAHYLKKHSNVSVPDIPFSYKIIKHCRDYVDRKIWESVKINYYQPNINRQLIDTNAEKQYNLPWRVK